MLVVSKIKTSVNVYAIISQFDININIVEELLPRLLYAKTTFSSVPDSELFKLQTEPLCSSLPPYN